MQLGTRWAPGSPPPADLPEVVAIAVSTVDEDLASSGVDTTRWRWTLTWLESRPVIDLDDGTSIRYDPDHDTATITHPGESVDDPFDED